jgi:hypothetical protein
MLRVIAVLHRCDVLHAAALVQHEHLVSTVAGVGCLLCGSAGRYPSVTTRVFVGYQVR